MAIRIRKIDDLSIRGWHYVALCAAESQEEEDDIYLNDGMHEALSNKEEIEKLKQQ